MPLIDITPIKRAAGFSILIAAIAAVFAFRGVFASGPSIKNVNPQGTVTNGSPKITLDTEDLARCKYDTKDVSYDSMGETLTTPDGLYHSASLGNLSKGSYTYYVRCRDFEGNSNSSSVKLEFKVGDITCVGLNCDTTSSADAPVLSGFLPSGIVYDSRIMLSLSTSKAADCRFSSYDKVFDKMTLLFSTSNRLYHTASVTLPAGGYYTYYVRCRDEAVKINTLAVKISFRYSAPYVAPSDSTPPVISSLAPSGDIDAATTTISCDTNESATCKYGTSDTDYDSLTGTMDSDSGKTNHSAKITLDAAGSYTYYVRCKDKVGNKTYCT